MGRVILAFLVLNLAACSSMQAVAVKDLQTQENPAGLYVGDRVEVVTKDNEKFEFAIKEINADGLGGKFGFIPYEKMRSLKVHRPGSGETDLTWLWAVMGLVAFVALISAADSVSICSPGPCP
jgi:protein involved in temperature-dependent protein secretion